MVTEDDRAAAGLVRVRGRGGTPVGGGLLIAVGDGGAGWVVTCAHVVNAALGRPALESAAPPDDAQLPLDLWVRDRWVPCEGRSVSGGWWPLAEHRGDIAVLEAAPLPAGVGAPRLRLPLRGEDRRFTAHGFPEGHPDGIGSHGLIKDGLVVGVEWTQVEVTSGRKLTRGYSGTPLLDVGLGAVVGIAVAEDATDPAAGVAAMIPLGRLAGYWPPLAELLPSRLTADPALAAHWDPRSRGVEHAARGGWFFTGRRQALSQLVGWLTAPPLASDNVRVITGGPGSGKSAVLARLVTLSDPRYRARLPAPLPADDPVATLPSGAIDVAVHARATPTDKVITRVAEAAGAPQGDIDNLIDVEHPGFGGDSILPRCSGLGGRCLPRYRRMAEPRSDHFSAFVLSNICPAALSSCPAWWRAPPGQAPRRGAGISSSGTRFCAAGSRAGQG